jgi:hypothetical protein
MGIIYKAENKENGKIYIGQTNNTLEKRIKDHLNVRCFQIKNSEEDMFFHEILQSYGENYFTFEIIDKSNSDTELNEKEKYWIKFYNSTNSDFGYNKLSGGKGYKTPMFYDGSESEEVFLRNNSIRYSKDETLYKGNMKLIKCPFCGYITEIRVDFFSNPLNIIYSRENPEYLKKCNKCKKYLYQNLTEYRELYVNPSKSKEITTHIENTFKNSQPIKEQEGTNFTDEETLCLLYMQNNRNIKKYDYSFIKKKTESSIDKNKLNNKYEKIIQKLLNMV